VSALSCVIGSLSAAARLLFAFGRAGLAPRIGQAHAVHGTPSAAIVLAGGLCLLGILVWAPLVGAADYYGDLATIGTLALIFVYLGVIAAEVTASFAARRPIRAPLGLAGIVMLLWPLYDSVYPIPDHPAKLWPYVVIIWICAGRRGAARSHRRGGCRKRMTVVRAIEPASRNREGHMVSFALDPEHTALINVDLQNCFVDGYPLSAPDGLVVLDRVNHLAAACRAAGILVVHTSHVLRPDGSNTGVLAELVPEVRAGMLNKGTPSAASHERLMVDPRTVDEMIERISRGARTSAAPVPQNRTGAQHKAPPA
jgi:hypothetical protein